MLNTTIPPKTIVYSFTMFSGSCFPLFVAFVDDLRIVKK